MILRRIRVAGWQCFAADCCVGPFGDGLNVVHAPNGTGKSTLLGAVRRALLDRHTSASAEAEALRTRGAALVPRVAVEFERGGVAYRIEKQFLEAPFARLARREADAWVPLAERDAADAFVRELLHAGATRGGFAATPDQLGIAHALWAAQADGLALGDGGVARPVIDLVREALAAEAAGGAAGAAIEARINREYDAIFTPGGALKKGAKGAPEVAIADRLDGLRAERGAVAVDVAAFEAAQRDVASAATERDAARRAAEACRAAAARLAGERDRHAAARAAAAEADRAAQVARQVHDRTDAIVRRVTTARADLAVADAAASALAAPASGPTLGERRAHHAAALAALDAARADRIAASAADAEARAAATFVEASTALAAAVARRDAIVALDAQLAAARAGRARLRAPAPAPAELSRLHAAAQALRDARAALATSTATLRFTPAADARLDVRVADVATGPRDVRAGEPITIHGTPTVVVVVEGVGEFRVDGPNAASAADRRAALARATVAWQDMAAPFLADLHDGSASGDPAARASDAASTSTAGPTAPAGACDAATSAADPEATLEALRRRAVDAATIDAAISVAEGERRATLGRDRDAAALRDRAAAAAGALDAAARPTWRESPPDATALRRTADLARAAAEAGVESAERAATSTAATLAAADKDAATIAARREAAAARVADARRRLDEASSEDGGRDDVARAAALREAALASHAAAEAERAARDVLGGFAEDPAIAAARVVGELEAARVRAERAIELESAARERLRVLADRGAYSVLALAEEAIAEAEAELARARARSSAIRLLRDTVAAERDAVARAVGAGVEQAATALWRRIAGDASPAGDVRLSAGLDAAAVDSAIVATLSGGEREQVRLAVRLALARALSASERQMVVLDDVLVASDATRLARVRALLEDAAGHAQVVVLTCHPERFASLSGATFFDLAAIRVGR